MAPRRWQNVTANDQWTLVKLIKRDVAPTLHRLRPLILRAARAFAGDLLTNADRLVGAFSSASNEFRDTHWSARFEHPKQRDGCSTEDGAAPRDCDTLVSSRNECVGESRLRSLSR
jgi:hypothetical protein